MLCAGVQVNGRDIQEVSHEEAALALKGAGTTVELAVEYRVVEFNSFQQTLQKLQEAPVAEAAAAPASPEPPVAPVKQLYVRLVSTGPHRLSINVGGPHTYTL